MTCAETTFGYKDAPIPLLKERVCGATEVINAIIEHAKAQGTSTYDDEVLKVGTVHMEGGGGSG